jgi:hypothetical protein
MPERPLSEAEINKIRTYIATSAETLKTSLHSLDPEQEALRKFGLKLLIEDSLESDRLNVDLLDEASYKLLLKDVIEFFLTYEREEPIYWARDIGNVTWRPSIIRPQDAHLAGLAYSFYGKEASKKELRRVSTNYYSSLSRVWDRIKSYEETTSTLSRHFGELSVPILPTSQSQPSRLYRDKSKIGTTSIHNWRNPFLTKPQNPPT